MIRRMIRIAVQERIRRGWLIAGSLVILIIVLLHDSCRIIRTVLHAFLPSKELCRVVYGATIPFVIHKGTNFTEHEEIFAFLTKLLDRMVHGIWQEVTIPYHPRYVHGRVDPEPVYPHIDVLAINILQEILYILILRVKVC